MTAIEILACILGAGLCVRWARQLNAEISSHDASPEAPPLRLTIESQPPLADAGKPCEASGIPHPERLRLERLT